MTEREKGERERAYLLTYALHKFTRGDDYESVGGSIAASSDTVNMNLAYCYAAEGKSWCPAEVLIALCSKIWFR